MVGPDAAELGASQGRQPTPAPVASSAQVGEQHAGGQVDKMRIDGHVDRRTERPPGADEPERVFRIDLQGRQMVDAAKRRPRPGGGDTPRPGRQALDLHLPVLLAQIARRPAHGHLQARQTGAVLSAQREPYRVAGGGPVRSQRALDRQIPRGQLHQEPGDQQRRQERERQEIELPGAEDAGRQVGARSHDEEAPSADGRASHGQGPGTGTVSSTLAITASSVRPWTLASGDRMSR